jgi:hypothetical protein
MPQQVVLRTPGRAAPEEGPGDAPESMAMQGPTSSAEELPIPSGQPPNPPDPGDRTIVSGEPSGHVGAPRWAFLRWNRGGSSAVPPRRSAQRHGATRAGP